MENIDLVILKESDLKELSVLYEELYGKAPDNETMKATLEHVEKSGNHYLIGAKMNDVLVGSISATISLDMSSASKPFMVIENVVVLSRFKRKNIGSLMIDYTEAIARENDCYYIMLVSENYRQEAHAFYRNLNYEPVQGFKKRLF